MGAILFWDCKYHLDWTTKYRYEVLGGDVGKRCWEFLREISISHEIHIHAGSINRDHIHMLVSISPNGDVRLNTDVRASGMG
ncbi:IS200/IS605 family transposase [Hoeflea sp.]|uniref:IS200/IS605 family transposase n=1 Tax=Hoeflea sp. TaxID=1940281 RepID=UPI003A8EBBEC